MKVRKERNVFALEMKTELDILNYGGHDYLLSASALPLDEQLFPPHFSILGKKNKTKKVKFWGGERKVKGVVIASIRGDR